MKYLFLLSLGLLLLGVLTSCIPAEKQCSVDTDCVQASCCHARDAVNKEYAPTCQGILCTMECVPGTIDCGQGKVQCVDNQCLVVRTE